MNFNKLFLLYFVLLVFIVACKGPTKPLDAGINPNIIQIAAAWNQDDPSNKYISEYRMADRRGNRLITFVPFLQIFTLGPNLEPISDTLFIDDKFAKNWKVVSS